MASAVLDAQKRFDASADGAEDATLQPLLTGLRVTRELRAQLRTMTVPDEGRFEIEFRLRQKEREFQQAILLANGVRIEALADDGVVVPGQPVRLSVVLANRGATPLNIRQVGVEGLNGDATCTLTAPAAGGGRGGPAGGRGAPPATGPPLSALAKDQVGRCDLSLTIPANTRVTEPYWHREGEAGRYVFDDDAPFGLPYRPTPFYVQATLSLGPNTSEVFAALPVQYRYEGDIFSGEKRSSLLVVPALSVRVTPGVTIVPWTPPAPARAAAAAGRPRPRAAAAPAPPVRLRRAAGEGLRRRRRRRRRNQPRCERYASPSSTTRKARSRAWWRWRFRKAGRPRPPSRSSPSRAKTKRRPSDSSCGRPGRQTRASTA